MPHFRIHFYCLSHSVVLATFLFGVVDMIQSIDTKQVSLTYAVWVACILPTLCIESCQFFALLEFTPNIIQMNNVRLLRIRLTKFVCVRVDGMICSNICSF